MMKMGIGKVTGVNACSNEWKGNFTSYYWEHILGYIVLLALPLTLILSPFRGRGLR
jgi:hypothetical protein